MQKIPDSMISRVELSQSLREHVRALTTDIGERSVDRPENLRLAAEYILGFYEALGLPATLEPYRYRDFTVANVVAEAGVAREPERRYILGAHYDTVRGTVGADDNASAVAVLLETARWLKALEDGIQPGLQVRCVGFTLEERPAFWTPYRGSWVHARRTRRAGERVDGMLCLEMVGYRSREPGSQRYPFPLRHLGYPDTGDFIGIVADTGSRRLAASICSAFARNPCLPVQCLIVPLKGWPTPFVRRSDHVSFWDMGYPAVMITDTAEFRNPHYHTSRDTLDTLDFAFMAELVVSLLHFFCSGKTLYLSLDN